MADKPVVWIIDNEQWPRAYLRTELDENGIEGIGYTRLSEAVADLRIGALPKPKAIILELHDQYLEPILLETLAQSGIPVVVLTGAVESDKGILEAYGWTAVMRRPFTIGSVITKVQEIAGLDSKGLNEKGDKQGG